MGIDPSTKTGICKLDASNEALEYETQLVYSVVDSKTQMNHMHRVKFIVDTVMAHVYSFEPNLVVVENYSFASKFVSFTAVEINAILRWQLFDNHIPYILVPPTKLKKFITGKGNAKKDVMRLEVYKHWGVEAKTDDEIDAFGLALFGAAYRKFVRGFPKVNMSAVIDNDIEVVEYDINLTNGRK